MTERAGYGTLVIAESKKKEEYPLSPQRRRRQGFDNADGTELLRCVLSEVDSLDYSLFFMYGGAQLLAAIY